jgi:ribosome biogenesis protein UTP30
MPKSPAPAKAERPTKRKGVSEPATATPTPAEKPKKRKVADTAATPAAAAPVPSAKKAKAPPAAVPPSNSKKAKSPAPSSGSKKAKSPAKAAAESRLSEEQVSKAVAALCKHLEGSKTSLLDDETGSTMHLQIALNKMPKGRDQTLSRKQHKPHILALPHPARTLGECDVVLFTKDPQREYKDKLAAAQVERVKVIGIDKLRKKYVEYEAKRNLCSGHDVFLSDDRVLPLLPKLLGKSFFKKSKQPAAVDLTRKNVRESLRQAVEGTRFLPPSGTLVSVLVGYSGQPQAHLVANVLAVAKQAVPKLKGDWDVVQALYLKSAESVALPLYQRPSGSKE